MPGKSSIRLKVNRGNLKRMQRRAGPAARAGAEELLRASLEQVPVDTGRLKASGTVSEGRDEAAAGYSEAYAVYVHEKTWVSHAGGKAKFLEDPVYDGGVQKAMLEAAGDVFSRALK